MIFKKHMNKDTLIITILIVLNNFEMFNLYQKVQIMSSCKKIM